MLIQLPTSKLKNTLLNSAFSAPLRLFSSLCVKNAFAFASSADHSLAPAEPTFGGGHTGAFRCTCVISAASAEPAAIQKCQFSGFSLASRPPFQRINCTFRILCNIALFLFYLVTCLLPLLTKHLGRLLPDHLFIRLIQHKRKIIPDSIK